jgi:hypothetical protein
MKEILFFSLVLLFIACQNEPHNLNSHSNLPSLLQTEIQASLAESVSCIKSPHTLVDVNKELQDPEQPGFYYREMPNRSELITENNQAELVCISQVTNSNDTETPSPAENKTVTATETAETPAEDWQYLTQKWELTPVIATCVDENANSENPSCEDSIFMAEDGKLFSANLEDISPAL